MGWGSAADRVSLSVLEIVGVPGCGKTTVGTLAMAQAGGTKSWSRPILYALVKLRLERLFAILAFVRYHRVINAMSPGENERNSGKFRPSDMRLVLASMRGWNSYERTSEQLKMEVLKRLTYVMMKSLIVRLEAICRRRLLVLDEGILQEGLGISLRAPSSRRTDAQVAFLATLPSRMTCVIVKCPTETAIARALRRPGGLPKALRDTTDSVGAREHIHDSYVAMTDFVDMLARDRRLNVSIVESVEPPSMPAGVMARVVESAARGRPISWWLKDSHRAASTDRCQTAELLCSSAWLRSRRRWWPASRCLRSSPRPIARTEPSGSPQWSGCCW